MKKLWSMRPERRGKSAALGIERTSDETRVRWVLLLCGVLAVVVAVAALWSERDRVYAGALSRPHQRAELKCASCHQETGEPESACTTCHGAHPSARAGHRDATQQGALTCISCHRIHEDAGGVAVSAGQAWRFGTPAQTLVPIDAVRGEGVVPVIPAEACGRCHALQDPQDPVARCLGPANMSLCFDEHVAVRGSTLGTAQGAQERMTLWTVAREVVAAQPEPPRPPTQNTNLLWGTVATSLFVATAAWAWGQRPGTRARPDEDAPLDVAPPKRRRLPQIDASTCLGCSACVDACPYDVLKIERYVAELARPDDCCGLILCEQKCPNGSLVVHDGPPIEDRPEVHDDLESADVPGLYLAGDLTGMPLIRNAINQGAVAVRSLVAGLPRQRDANALDVVIVGAGPSGLSAALEAKKQGLRFAVLEQGALAQSIRSFPRGKLVFDQPLQVPLIGDLWLAEATKEELLRQWTRIARKHALPIHEHHRVGAIERRAENFVITAHTPDEDARFVAARVVLAIGRRGTPRTLEAPLHPAMETHVHHSLADARTFAGRACVVVGLGDVAMEAAVALAHQPHTPVTLVARGEDFRRGKARNIEAVQRAVEAGRIVLHWNSAVETVDDGAVVLRSGDERTRVPAESMFVMIGSIAPWAFLAAVGVRRADDPIRRPA